MLLRSALLKSCQLFLELCEEILTTRHEVRHVAWNRVTFDMPHSWGLAHTSRTPSTTGPLCY